MDETQRIRCTACQLEIIGTEQRRIHYRSDLHLVNLKRKVGGLGPLTNSEFTRRLAILNLNRQLNGTAGDEDDETGEGQTRASKRRREKTLCELCRKTFSSRQAFLSHERSKRHVDMLNRQDTDMSEISSNTAQSVVSTVHVDEIETEVEQEPWTWAEDDDNDELAVDDELQRRLNGWDDENSYRRCVFNDNHPICSDSKSALQCMSKCSGFFVPYKEFLSAPDGLVRYLAQKVFVGYSCLACDKGFRSVEDVRKHMKDVGHCRMTCNEESFIEEYGEFYNWTNPHEDENESKEWEEINEDEEEDLNNSNNVVILHLDPGDTTSLVDSAPIGPLQTDTHDEEHPEVDPNPENICALTIGKKTIGHRSLARYYKQAAGSNGDTRDAVVAGQSAAEMRVSAWRSKGKDMNVTQANGQSFVSRRRQCFELSVGSSNYYVRKSKLRQNMAVLNSGYRP